jgi:hypothetical protein
MPPRTPRDACALPKSEKLGRPPSEKKRDQQLNLSLTQDEFAEIYWRSRRAGMRMVDYGRWRLLGGEKQPVIPPQAIDQSQHLLFAELRRLGNNLNQLVRICHATRRAPPESLEILLERIRQAINRGMSK